MYSRRNEDETSEHKAKGQYKFECSLDPSEVPGIKAKWSSDEKFYPFVDNSTFNKYCLFKDQGNRGQQEKAIRMLQSRKIVTVKTIHEQSGMFVRTMIKKVRWCNNPGCCSIISKFFLRLEKQHVVVQ